MPPTLELKLALPRRILLNLSSDDLAVMFFTILSIVVTAVNDTPGSCVRWKQCGDQAKGMIETGRCGHMPFYLT